MPAASRGSTAIADFAAHQRRRNLSPLTISHRRARLLAFGNWLDPTELLDATADDVNEWLDELDVSPTTRSTYIALLQAFFRWAFRAGLIDANPIELVDRPRLGVRLPRPIDDDDLAVALEYADARMRAWLLLGALAGFRCVEMSRLRVEDVNRQDMTLRVLGKGNKEGVVPLHPAVLAALVAYGLPGHGFVFTKLSGTDQPLSPSTISRYIGRFLESLGSSSRAHACRHWFASSIYGQTGDLLVTRDLLRHRSVATSEGYTKLDVTRSRDALLMLDGPAV